MPYTKKDLYAARKRAKKSRLSNPVSRAGAGVRKKKKVYHRYQTVSGKRTQLKTKRLSKPVRKRGR